MMENFDLPISNENRCLYNMENILMSKLLNENICRTNEICICWKMKSLLGIIFASCRNILTYLKVNNISLIITVAVDGV